MSLFICSETHFEICNIRIKKYIVKHYIYDYN